MSLLHSHVSTNKWIICSIIVVYKHTHSTRTLHICIMHHAFQFSIRSGYHQSMLTLTSLWLSVVYTVYSITNTTTNARKVCHIVYLYSFSRNYSESIWKAYNHRVLWLHISSAVRHSNGMYIYSQFLIQSAYKYKLHTILSLWTWCALKCPQWWCSLWFYHELRMLWRLGIYFCEISSLGVYLFMLHEAMVASWSVGFKTTCWPFFKIHKFYGVRNVMYAAHKYRESIHKYSSYTRNFCV